MWFARKDIEDVPVFRAAECLAVPFGFLERKDVQSLEQGVDRGPVLKRHVRITSPAGMGTEQLPGEDTARHQRPAQPSPHQRELSRRAERQAEARMHQVRAREADIGEGTADDRDPFRAGRRMHAGPGPEGAGDRASNARASVPPPQPRSTAIRPPPAPSRSQAASSIGRGSRPDDHA